MYSYLHKAIHEGTTIIKHSGFRYLYRHKCITSIRTQLVIVYSFFCVEPVGRRILDLLGQKQHESQVFSWERGQRPVWQTWQWGPICDTGFLNQGPQNGKSAASPLSRQHHGWHSGPCRWWRSPGGQWTQHWPQLGLDRDKMTRLWSQPPGSPTNRSVKRDENRGGRGTCEIDGPKAADAF